MKYILLLLLIGGMAACNEVPSLKISKTTYIIKLETNGTLHEFYGDTLFRVGDTVIWDDFSSIKGIIIRKSK